MYGSVSNASYGDQTQAGWYQGGGQVMSTDGRWPGPQHGWQQHPGQQQQLQQPYQTQYQQQLHPYQQQPYRQDQYYQQYRSQQEGPQRNLSQIQARAAAVAGPQNAVVRGDARASKPDPRPSKRARVEQEDKQEPKQKRRQGRQGKQQDPVQPQQQQQQQQRPEQMLPQPDFGAPWLRVLNDDVIAFAQQVLPTAEEQEQRQTALCAMEAVARGALGPWTQQPFEVMLFGSGRAGLALHSSDMDIMITGLCRPGTDGGYDKNAKQVVATHLRKVEREAFKRMSVRSSKLIAHARIPVLKLELRNGIELDVSLNDTGGIRAANFLQSWQQDYAALRPMVLVLKSILKLSGLGDVASGGLGSWSVANMAIAHLMMEDNAGAQVDSPGHMLYSFFKRFGVDWNLDRDAVAVAQGGITTRVNLAAAGGPMAGTGKLFVKDPLTGREVAGGSHRYADVMQLWRDLYLNLREEASAAAATAAAGRSQFSVLSVVLDCAAVLRRVPAVSHAGGQGYGFGGWAGGNGGYGMPQGGGSRRRDR